MTRSLSLPPAASFAALRYTATVMAIMTSWTAPYVHRSRKTVSGFSPSSFLAANMTGSMTNILLNPGPEELMVDGLGYSGDGGLGEGVGR
jgi:hypothetical protein